MAKLQSAGTHRLYGVHLRPAKELDAALDKFPENDIPDNIFEPALARAERHEDVAAALRIDDAAFRHAHTEQRPEDERPEGDDCTRREDGRPGPDENPRPAKRARRGALGSALERMGRGLRSAVNYVTGAAPTRPEAASTGRAADVEMADAEQPGPAEDVTVEPAGCSCCASRDGRAEMDVDGHCAPETPLPQQVALSQSEESQGHAGDAPSEGAAVKTLRDGVAVEVTFFDASDIRDEGLTTVRMGISYVKDGPLCRDDLGFDLRVCPRNLEEPLAAVALQPWLVDMFEEAWAAASSPRRWTVTTIDNENYYHDLLGKCGARADDMGARLDAGRDAGRLELGLLGLRPLESPEQYPPDDDDEPPVAPPEDDNVGGEGVGPPVDSVRLGPSTPAEDAFAKAVDDAFHAGALPGAEPGDQLLGALAAYLSRTEDWVTAELDPTTRGYVRSPTTVNAEEAIRTDLVARELAFHASLPAGERWPLHFADEASRPAPKSTGGGCLDAPAPPTGVGTASPPDERVEVWERIFDMAGAATARSLAPTCRYVAEAAREFHSPQVIPRTTGVSFPEGLAGLTGAEQTRAAAANLRRHGPERPPTSPTDVSAALAEVFAVHTGKIENTREGGVRRDPRPRVLGERRGVTLTAQVQQPATRGGVAPAPVPLGRRRAGGRVRGRGPARHGPSPAAPHPFLLRRVDQEQDAPLHHGLRDGREHRLDPVRHQAGPKRLQARALLRQGLVALGLHQGAADHLQQRAGAARRGHTGGDRRVALESGTV